MNDTMIFDDHGLWLCDAHATKIAVGQTIVVTIGANGSGGGTALTTDDQEQRPMTVKAKRQHPAGHRWC